MSMQPEEEKHRTRGDMTLPTQLLLATFRVHNPALYICLIAHHSWQQIIHLLRQQGLWWGAVINSLQPCTVFLASCCKRLQNIPPSPCCASNINVTCHSCVLRSERILAHFVGGGAGSVAPGHGGSNRAAVKPHCTVHWASCLTFMFWSIEHKWCKQTLGSPWECLCEIVWHLFELLHYLKVFRHILMSKW